MARQGCPQVDADGPYGVYEISELRAWETRVLTVW